MQQNLQSFEMCLGFSASRNNTVENAVLVKQKLKDDLIRGDISLLRETIALRGHVVRYLSL